VIVVGLGGNVGDVRARFERAREALGARRSARLYRSAPIGPAQADFLNSAVALDEDWLPQELAALIGEIEQQLGRRRAEETRWGPRTLDLDVLVWGARVLREPLEVPHPRLVDRRFALAPLVDLVGDDFVVPGAGRAGELLARVGGQAVVDLGTW
jgi:2-amino-4-hydroxy-6-hydroxymethyldihydropteridine diphosphokinase